jgi:phosphoribosylanthranilate isomerase
MVLSALPEGYATGISPENVAEGIERVKPAGVDSCTLTNAIDEDGRPIRFRKDLRKVRRLVDAAKKTETL